MRHTCLTVLTVTVLIRKGENGVCSASLYLGIIAQVAVNVNRLFYYLHFVIIFPHLNGTVCMAVSAVDHVAVQMQC